MPVSEEIKWEKKSAASVLAVMAWLLSKVRNNYITFIIMDCMKIARKEDKMKYWMINDENRRIELNNQNNNKLKITKKQEKI